LQPCKNDWNRTKEIVRYDERNNLVFSLEGSTLRNRAIFLSCDQCAKFRSHQNKSKVDWYANAIINNLFFSSSNFKIRNNSKQFLLLFSKSQKLKSVSFKLFEMKTNFIFENQLFPKKTFCIISQFKFRTMLSFKQKWQKRLRWTWRTKEENELKKEVKEMLPNY
jgi:hypothetical protein